MQAPLKKNIVSRFFSWIWRFLDETRRTFFNLLTLFLLVLLIGALFETESELNADTALVISPNGIIVEQFTRDPLQRAVDNALDEENPETQLRDILAAIEYATTDDKISRLVLVTSRFWGAGLSKLQEIRTAVAAFKSSGKEVIAWTEGMSQHHYYLASMADEIWMHTDGFVFIEGYGGYRNYFKAGLDMLGVDIHLFKVGEYKSFAEPFIRDDMSDDARTAGKYLYNGLWQSYLRDVAAARDVEQAQLRSIVEGQASLLGATDGDMAKMALGQGLVDKLMSRQEMRQALAERGAWDDDVNSFRQIGMDSYIARMPSAFEADDQIAVVVAQGAIMGGDQPPGTVGAESAAKLLRKARYNDNVKAVVLRVDSPGGGVFASELIRQEIQEIKKAGKPVVASMSSVAASGGYWISMNADEIWANDATITGSIGIFGLFPTYPKMLDKIGIHTDGVGTTTFAGAFRADRELQPAVGELIQAIIDNGYQEFISKVAAARGLNIESVDSVARGRVWTGDQGLERGLVDKIGGIEAAIQSAAKLAGLDAGTQTVYIEQEVSGLDKLLLDMSASVLTTLGLDTHLAGLQGSIPSSLLHQLRQGAKELQWVLGEGNDPNNAYVHCFCDAPL